MNKLLVTILLCALGACGAPPDVMVAESSAAEAAAATPDATAKLTVAEAKVVLVTIDQTCGDTWCDGDYGWKFEKLVAYVDHVTLTTLVTSPTNVTDWRSCRINGFLTYASMIEPLTKTANQLQWPFYEAVDACITKIEGSVK